MAIIGEGHVLWLAPRKDGGIRWSPLVVDRTRLVSERRKPTSVRIRPPAPYGSFDYRLGHGTVTAERGVRLPYEPPLHNLKYTVVHTTVLFGRPQK